MLITELNNDRLMLANADGMYELLDQPIQDWGTYSVTGNHSMRNGERRRSRSSIRDGNILLICFCGCCALLSRRNCYCQYSALHLTGKSDSLSVHAPNCSTCSSIVTLVLQCHCVPLEKLRAVNVIDSQTISVCRGETQFSKKSSQYSQRVPLLAVIISVYYRSRRKSYVHITSIVTVMMMRLHKQNEMDSTSNGSLRIRPRLS